MSSSVPTRSDFPAAMPVALATVIVVAPAAAATVIVVAAPAGLSRAMISPEGRFRNFFLMAMVKAPPEA
jgi:hypothetical protein